MRRADTLEIVDLPGSRLDRPRAEGQDAPMTMPAAAIFVIDDDPGVRAALERLLRIAGWDVMAYPSADAFLQALPVVDCGCILLDVSMPGMTGPQLHEQLAARGNEYPIIYLTGHSSVAIGVTAMKSGAFDFLEKPVDGDLLIPTIEKAIEHHRRTRAARTRLDAIKARLYRLSAREREVMDHVIAGRLNKQIASDLGIALKTVKVHRGRVMQKMQVRSVAELVQLCDDLGIRRLA